MNSHYLTRREYTTPNIDRIAAEGMRFTQAYANSPVCTASRTALITGRYQYRLPVGLEEPLAANSRRDVGLPPQHPTLPSLLKRAGYGTTLIGKWHLGWLPDFSPLKSGYDHFWGFRGGGLDYFTHKSGPANTDTDDLWDGDVKIHQSGYLTDLIGDRAISAINDYAKARQTFFISLHFNAPHSHSCPLRRRLPGNLRAHGTTNGSADRPCVAGSGSCRHCQQHHCHFHQ